MLQFIMLNVVMLSVVMLSFIMLSVVAPTEGEVLEQFHLIKITCFVNKGE